MSKTVVARDIEGNSYDVSIDELSWRPSAYAIVIQEGRVLLSKQFNGYDLPGGGIDLGETPEEAAIRETKEETGIDVAEPKLLRGETSFFRQNHKSGSVVQSLQLYYTCSFVGGELSTVGFDEYEKEYADMPEWLPIGKLNTITVANSYDWRDLVGKVAQDENTGD